jgi:hypothetical protein
MTRLMMAAALLTGMCSAIKAEQADPATVVAELKPQIESQLKRLQDRVQNLMQSNPDDPEIVADVSVYAKAAEWLLRHNEFHKPDYAKWALAGLETGLQRADLLAAGQQPWRSGAGSRILAYVSRVDGSIQPFSVTLPAEFDASPGRRWPVHLVLHGRGDTLNEVSFIRQHDGKPLKENPAWIQLDVFGRTNNAYRWSGETDVFEALHALGRLYRIDDRRVTLWGFSMGGAGAWHLGLQHPDRWSSVGAGAGFVDTVKYLNLKEPLSPLHQKLVRIYDAVDYAGNAYDVPIVGYGGELDKQLLAAKTMTELGQTAGAPIPLLIGPGVEHKWHPDSLKEFMAFHAEHAAKGKPKFPQPLEIKFVTYTPRYNTCFWATLEEQIEPYAETRIEAKQDGENDRLTVTTRNVAAFQVDRNVAESIAIDGNSPTALRSAADGLLPGVVFVHEGDRWRTLDHRSSIKFFENGDRRKRHGLQGPIDDAFMDAFLCVKPTGSAWNGEHAAWAEWSLERFEHEYDKWLRARLPVVNDTQVSPEQIVENHLVLFGDPGSNAVLAKVIDRLPIKWTKTELIVDGKNYDPQTHAAVLVFPNPLNPHKYVVINSGHTFHEAEFKASNATLYPRLGDIAVLKFARQSNGQYADEAVWAAVFDAGWKFPESPRGR